MAKLLRIIQLFLPLLLTMVGAENGVAQLQPLHVSPDHRYLVTADDKPFFWLGDTAWELFHRTTKSEAETYFKKRAEQGFNVIQAVALAELDVLNVPNRNGDLPLRNGDPALPNEAYFRYMDTLIELASQNGLYIALLPTWVTRFSRTNGAKARRFSIPKTPRFMAAGLPAATVTAPTSSG